MLARKNSRGHGSPSNDRRWRAPRLAATAVAGLSVTALLAAGCGTSSVSASGGKQAAAPPTTPAATTTTVPATPSVAITEKDFNIAPAVTETTAGLVDFAVTDNGPTAHELLVFQSDLTPDKFPMKDGKVDEAGDGISKVFDSGANIDVNTTKTFHAALTAGNYYLVCNLPGHFLAGMHTAFTVKPAATAPVAIPTIEKDFAITPSTTTAKAGLIDFAISNTGPSPHEFLIFQSDLAPDKFPVGADGRVDEAADGITKVFDSGTNVDVNGSKTFSTALPPGKYVLVCNLPGGHYTGGMHTAFTVS